MANYIDLSDLKSALGIKPVDTSRDPELITAILATEAMIERETGRVFTLDATATPRIYEAVTGQDLLITDDIGDVTGLTVEWGVFAGLNGYQAYDPSVYEVYPLNAIAKGYPVTGIVALPGWGRSGYSRVRVTAKWGWPTVPDEIKQACMLQAARLWRRKDSPGGIVGSETFGYSRVSRVDPDVWGLISHLRLPGFGG